MSVRVNAAARLSAGVPKRSCWLIALSMTTKATDDKIKACVKKYGWNGVSVSASITQILGALWDIQGHRPQILQRPKGVTVRDYVGANQDRHRGKMLIFTNDHVMPYINGTIHNWSGHGDDDIVALVPIDSRQNVSAMVIKPGANLSVGLMQGQIQEFMKAIKPSKSKLSLVSYKIISNHGNQYVLRSGARTLTYYLVESDLDLQVIWDVPERRASLNETNVKVIGCVVTEPAGDLEEVSKVWVTPEYQGKGYGTGLHRLAYQHSKHGICSSTNLGTQSLATLISLYRKEHKMELLYDGELVNRGEVRFKGTDIFVNSTNICEDDIDFVFKWKK